MFVINVLPLSRTAPGILSYRSAEDLAMGSVVDIMLRKTLTQGIVVSSLPVQDAKEMLKRARFLLSSSVPSPSGKLPDSVMRAAEKVADYHATSTGAVLASLFAEYIRAGAALPVMEFSEGPGFVREVVEDAISERVKEYEKRIHECTERGAAALLIAPTIAECDFWKKTFAAHTPLLISSSVTGAARTKALAKASAHTGLIIATPSFSWVPVSSLGVILIDRISAGTYTLPKRPYLSTPYALEALAEARRVPLILGDFPVPLEYRPIPAKNVIHTPKNISVLDVRNNPEKLQEDPKPFAALSENAILRIKAELEEGGRVVVLATRKGYAPAVVCKDCGQAQTDERGVPLLFSTAHGNRVFISRDGLSVLDAKRTCTRCESWNLLPLGIGVERVEEELRKAFPDRAISVLTTESLTSRKAAKNSIQDAQRPGSLLVGTEALLPWMLTYDGPPGLRPLGIIASADSLLSLPFWRARERFIRLSYFMSGLCHELLLQTRRPDDSAVQCLTATDTNVTEISFWSEETALRKALSYPPYGTLITLSYEGTPTALENFQTQIKGDLEKYSPNVLSGQGTVVITLPEGTWLNIELRSYLRELPPQVRVRIDPESLW